MTLSYYHSYPPGYLEAEKEACATLTKRILADYDHDMLINTIGQIEFNRELYRWPEHSAAIKEILSSSL